VAAANHAASTGPFFVGSMSIVARSCREVAVAHSSGRGVPRIVDFYWIRRQSVSPAARERRGEALVTLGLE